MFKHLIMFTALLMAIPAIGYLISPGTMLTIVGIHSDSQLDFVLRTSGVGLLALVPGVWVLRTDATSPAAWAVAVGLVSYLVLSSVVDFHAYTQLVVSFASIPSIAIRLLLAVALVVLWRRDQTRLP